MGAIQTRGWSHTRENSSFFRVVDMLVQDGSLTNFVILSFVRLWMIDAPFTCIKIQLQCKKVKLLKDWPGEIINSCSFVMRHFNLFKHCKYPDPLVVEMYKN